MTANVDTSAENERMSLLATGIEVLAAPARLVGLVVTAAVIGTLYTILLPFSYTQRFSLANWEYLTPAMIVWSAVLGLGMAFVLVMQVYAIRLIAARRSVGLGGAAFVVGLLPSLLCCSPALPTLLAFIGLSATQVYGTTGTIQYFFLTYQTEFLTGSLALLVLTAWWGLRRIARGRCQTDQGCAVPDEASTTTTVSDDRTRP